jgi:hypothetical protein
MKPIDLTNDYDKYLSYLQSQTWAKLRNLALKRDDYHCSICQNPHNLEVHHLRYPKVLGTEPVSDLMTLCDKCHERLENWKKGHKTNGTVVKWTPPRKILWIKAKDIDECQLLYDKCQTLRGSGYEDIKIIFYAQEENKITKISLFDVDVSKIEETLKGYETKMIYDL